MIYELEREMLLKYNISNADITPTGRILTMDKPLPDYSNLFPCRKVKFTQLFFERQKSSLGIAKKFFGQYNKKNCMVKFSKFNSKDLENELIYKQVADALGIPCCKVYMQKYFNKYCIASIYEYAMSLS